MPISSEIGYVALLASSSIGGGLCFKNFTTNQDVLWFVAGACLLNLGNVFYVMLMQQSGLARAVTLSSAAIIILSTIAGVYFRENLSLPHFIAAALTCIALLLSLHGDAANSSITSPQPLNTTMEDSNG